MGKRKHTVYVEQRHDEIRAVVRGQVVSVDDVLHSRCEIEMTEGNGCLDKDISIFHLMLNRVDLDSPLGLPVVPLVCKTKATSLSLAGPLPFSTFTPFFPPGANLIPTFRPSNKISATGTPNWSAAMAAGWRGVEVVAPWGRRRREDLVSSR